MANSSHDELTHPSSILSDVEDLKLLFFSSGMLLTGLSRSCAAHGGARHRGYDELAQADDVIDCAMSTHTNDANDHNHTTKNSLL